MAAPPSARRAAAVLRHALVRLERVPHVRRRAVPRVANDVIEQAVDSQ
jgi:hypothetical protein